jgi:predicted metal-dependent hydrolase
MEINMARPIQTPAELAITKRDWKFGRGESTQRWWHGGDPGRTAFYNALSSTFPVGEKFFMTAIRPYRDYTMEPLRGQIDDFMYQESTHSREHVFFNRQARDAGYDIRPGEDRAARTIAWARRRPPIVQLAATCALEHFTAAMAHAALADPAHLDSADPKARDLWRWHAIEEIEHKAVAYDTWNHATRDMPRVRRWLLRSVVMATASARLHYVLFRNTAGLLAQDGSNDWRTWLRLLGYLYGRPGMMRVVLVSMIGYFRPGFHPWNLDDRALVSSALATLAPPGEAVAV